jgi:hypothetical protein
MLLEDQRFLHEDLERLEQAIAERVGEDPKNVRTPEHLAQLALTVSRSKTDSTVTTKLLGSSLEYKSSRNGYLISTVTQMAREREKSKACPQAILSKNSTRSLRRSKSTTDSTQTSRSRT